MEEKILNEEVVETTKEKDLLEDNEPVNEVLNKRNLT